MCKEQLLEDHRSLGVRVTPPPVDVCSDALNAACRQPDVAVGRPAATEIEVVVARRQPIQVGVLRRIAETADLEHRRTLLERDDVAVRGDQAMARAANADGTGHADFLGRLGRQCPVDDRSPLEIAKVLRDLLVLKGDKELSFGERKMLDTARSLLVKELSIARAHPEEKIIEELNTIFAN